MTLNAFARVAGALLCLAAPALPGQYTAKTVTFKGATPYAQADLQAAAGLRPGAAFSQKDLQAAAQKLVDTGAFDDVQVALDGPVKTIAVNFSVKAVDPSRLLRVSFQDFPWWRPEELDSLLHARLPLYNGTVPEAGDQQEALQAALAGLTGEKVQGPRLDRALLDPAPGQPERLVEYSIRSPDIRVGKATFTGASAAFAPAVQKVATAATGRAYNAGLTDASLTHRVLNVYRDAGYLQAVLADVRVTAEPAAGRIDVDVAAAITEDQPFRVSSITYAGSPLLSAAAFATGLKLHPEDIAARKALLESLKPLSDAYHDQGYMDARVEAVPALDAATHHVAYTVSVVPGSQYRLGTVTALNLTPSQRAEFDRGWRLKPGDIYSAGYTAGFLKNNTALQTLAGLGASFKTVADPKTLLVDLTITFVRAAGPR